MTRKNEVINNKKINWKSVYEQVRWERDVAISQLKELGYGFGEKIKQKPVTPQEDILDKLYADIKEEKKVENIPEDVTMWDYIYGLDRALSIIDKYKYKLKNKEDMDFNREQEEEKE